MASKYEATTSTDARRSGKVGSGLTCRNMTRIYGRQISDEMAGLLPFFFRERCLSIFDCFVFQPRIRLLE